MTLKNRTRIGNSVDKELFEKLKILSDYSRIPMSRLLDEAIEDLIKKHNRKIPPKKDDHT